MHKGCHVSPEISVGGYDSEEEALTIVAERWNHRQNDKDLARRALDSE